MPISFAPRPPQGGQRSQDLSSKAATESFPLVLVDEQEICQRERNICWRWTRVVASSSKFLPSSRELVLLPRCVMKREIPVWNKSDLHSATVMICVDWPHSAAKKSFPTLRFGLSDPHLPPQAGGLLKSALQEPVLPLPPTSQWDPPRAVLLPPAGRALPPQGNWCRTSIWETNYRPRCATEEILRAGSVPPSPAADGFRGCFDPWPSLSNKYHRSRGNTIIRSRQAGPFVGEFVADD